MIYLKRLWYGFLTIIVILLAELLAIEIIGILSLHPLVLVFVALLIMSYFTGYLLRD
jgi:hypothetical protein